jgi:hypothetical protein
MAHGELDADTLSDLGLAPTGRFVNLRSWPTSFALVARGVKTFEARYNDRDYAEGDVLLLNEWLPDGRGYTGRWTAQVVTHVWPGGFGLNLGHWVVLSIHPYAGPISVEPDAVARVRGH